MNQDCADKQTDRNKRAAVSQREVTGQTGGSAVGDAVGTHWPSTKRVKEELRSSWTQHQRCSRFPCRGDWLQEVWDNSENAVIWEAASSLPPHCQFVHGSQMAAVVRRKASTLAAASHLLASELPSAYLCTMQPPLRLTQQVPSFYFVSGELLMTAHNTE